MDRIDSVQNQAVAPVPQSSNPPVGRLTGRNPSRDIRATSMFEPEMVNSDNDDAIYESPFLDRDAQEVIGVSIGPAQTHLKSPDTSVAEREAAIDLVDDNSEEEDIEEAGRDAIQSVVSMSPQTSPEHAPPIETQDGPELTRENQLPSVPMEPSHSISQRGEATRTVLRDVARPARNRSSSGPLSIPDFGNLKKFLPSIPVPKSPSFANFSFGDRPKDEMSESGGLRKRSNTAFSRGALSWATSIRSISPGKSTASPRGRLPSQFTGQASRDRESVRNAMVRGHQPSRSEIGPSQLDGAVLSATASTDDTRPHILRRPTSDGSLYLRRSLSRSSTLDDYAKWNNVQDQVNARFKAVTDSLQDSSFKLPSVPKFLRTEFSLARSNSWVNQKNKPSASGISDKVVADAQNMSAASKPAPDRVRTSHPVLKDAMSKMTGDIVLMGGYRGSVLRSATPPNQQVWVPIKVGLNLRKVDLEVGLDPEDEENMGDSIYPDGMLSHIGPVDISRRLLKKLRRCENARAGRLRVHDYGYDWRLSPRLLSRRLIQFLESLECNAAGTPPEKRGAIVVAHSLGGLITRHAINQRPDLFSGVVYAGVPQHCVNILGPLRSGDDVLISSRVLTAQVNFTFRTSYALLPEDGRCFINNETKEEYPVDFFDVDTWDEYRLSPCIAPPIKAPQQDYRKSLIDAMSSNLPSLPLSHKRSSIFGQDISSRNRSSSAPITTIRDLVKQQPSGPSLKQDVADIAHTAAHPDETIAPQLQSPPSSSPARDAPTTGKSISTDCTIPHDQAVSFLKRTLAEVLRFKQEARFIPAHHEHNVYPPASVLYTKSIPTVYGARVASREAIKYTDAYDDLAFAAGDGVCLARAAMLPEGYKVVKGGLVKSDRGHVGLLGDLEGVGNCLRAVMEGREKGCGLGIADHSERA